MFIKKIKYCLLFLTSLIPAALFAQADSSRFFSSFDGTKIFYEVKGEGEPVLLIHGFIANGQSWKRTALYHDLLEKGFKVIVPDLRGNGLSDKPHQPESYANDAEARDLVKLANELGLKNYKVVGYSRGSIITARLLVLDKRITHAVIGGMGADFTNPEWPRRKMFYRALMGDSVPELQAMVKNVKSSGLDQLALAYLQKEQPSTSKEELATLRNKVLVICGSEDEDNGSAIALTKLIPGAVSATVPGNHGTALVSKKFSNAVIMFLQK